MPSRPPRPPCRTCARKVMLDGSGQCYDCRNNPPKFSVGQMVRYLYKPHYLADSVDKGVFTVSKLSFSLDYGWEYGVKERVSWRINEKHLRSVANG